MNISVLPVAIVTAVLVHGDFRAVEHTGLFQGGKNEIKLAKVTIPITAHLIHVIPCKEIERRPLKQYTMNNSSHEGGGRERGVLTWYLSRPSMPAHHSRMAGSRKSIQEELPGQHQPSYTDDPSAFFT